MVQTYKYSVKVVLYMLGGQFVWAENWWPGAVFNLGVVA